MDALIVVFLTGLICMFIAMAKKPVYVLITAIIGLLLAIGLMISQWYNPPLFQINYEGLEFTKIGILFSSLALLFTFLIIIGGYSYFKKEVEHTGEYISLLLFSSVGALCMIAFTDLFMFFLGLEILSIPIYVMVGSNKKDLLSAEASLKYFFTGAFSTGVLLFGIAWVYGATGSFQLKEIEVAISEGSASGPLLSIGILMIMSASLFKVSAAPFHFWSPDVYQGSPNAVTGYMASVIKLVGMFAFLKLFTVTFGDMYSLWSGALYGLIVLTMFVGNLSAIGQTKFKRLMAYSSIAHAGYALIAIMSQEPGSDWNLWNYMFSYGFSILTLITISIVLDDKEDEFSSYKGIGRKNPFIGFMLVLSLFSLAALPPMAGFFGKFMVFSSAFNDYPILVILAIINSGIGVYYYLTFVIAALSKQEDDSLVPVLKPSILQYIVLVICAIGLLTGGFFVV
jgi:NADH-quinone oxidoreductase subunit N